MSDLSKNALSHEEQQGNVEDYPPDYRQHHRLGHHGTGHYELHGLRPDNALGIAKRAKLERTAKRPTKEKG